MYSKNVILLLTVVSYNSMVKSQKFCKEMRDGRIDAAASVITNDNGTSKYTHYLFKGQYFWEIIGSNGKMTVKNTDGIVFTDKWFHWDKKSVDIVFGFERTEAANAICLVKGEDLRCTFHDKILGKQIFSGKLGNNVVLGYIPYRMFSNILTDRELSTGCVIFIRQWNAREGTYDRESKVHCMDNRDKFLPQPLNGYIPAFLEHIDAQRKLKSIFTFNENKHLFAILVFEKDNVTEYCKIDEENDHSMCKDSDTHLITDIVKCDDDSDAEDTPQILIIVIIICVIICIAIGFIVLGLYVFLNNKKENVSIRNSFSRESASELESRTSSKISMRSKVM